MQIKDDIDTIWSLLAGWRGNNSTRFSRLSFWKGTVMRFQQEGQSEQK